MKIEEFKARIPVEEYIEGYVDIEEFEAKCRECNNWEKVWSCPPFTFNPLDYWRTYDKLLVLGYKITLDDGEKEAWREKLSEAKKKMSDYLFEMELMYIGGVSLSAGSCKTCSEDDDIMSIGDEFCTRSQGEPCRHPVNMRYSIEALGGNVGLTASKLLGLELQWTKDGEYPGYYVLVGGLLYSDKAFMM